MSIVSFVKYSNCVIECSQITINVLIHILNLLPNIDLIKILDLPLYEDIDKYNFYTKKINRFLKNNKITKLTLENISNLEQIYFILRNISNLQMVVNSISLKIKAKNNFHPAIICIFDTDEEYDMVKKFTSTLYNQSSIE